MNSDLIPIQDPPSLRFDSDPTQKHYHQIMSDGMKAIEKDMEML